MKSISQFDEIYLYKPFVDMRCQINGLSAIVEGAMQLSPDANRLFVFTNKRKKILKLLYWNGSGFALWMTRLEKDVFKWPRASAAIFPLNSRELGLLLDGIDISKQKPLEQLSYSTFS